MASVRFGSASAIVVVGLLFGAIAFARADTLPIPDPDLAVANSGDLCADGMGPCDRLPSFPPVVQPGHPHKHFAHHQLVKHRSPVAAARQESSGQLVAENSFQTWDLSCVGANAWSLLCPGAQLIGISY